MRDVVRIQLTVIVDYDADLIEWKVTGLAGPPATMIRSIWGAGAPTVDPAVYAEVVGALVYGLLEEYCEPF